MKDLDIVLNQDNQTSREEELKLALQAINNKNLKAAFTKELAKKGITKQAAIVKPITSYRRIIYAVAAILIFGLAAIFLLNNEISKLDLGQQYAMETTIKHPGLIKGDGNESNALAAIAAFNNKDWKKSIAAFEKLGLDKPENIFYLALSYFYDKQYVKCIDLFELHSMDSSIYTQERNWYLGLAYLLSGDEKNAKVVLIKIQRNEWQYEKAIKLLED